MPSDANQFAFDAIKRLKITASTDSVDSPNDRGFRHDAARKSIHRRHRRIEGHGIRSRTGEHIRIRRNTAANRRARLVVYGDSGIRRYMRRIASYTARPEWRCRFRSCRREYRNDRCAGRLHVVSTIGIRRCGRVHRAMVPPIIGRCRAYLSDTISYLQGLKRPCNSYAPSWLMVELSTTVATIESVRLSANTPSFTSAPNHNYRSSHHRQRWRRYGYSAPPHRSLNNSSRAGTGSRIPVSAGSGVL